jgi:histidyl-tRNA synthetase
MYRDIEPNVHKEELQDLITKVLPLVEKLENNKYDQESLEKWAEILRDAMSSVSSKFTDVRTLEYYKQEVTKVMNEMKEALNSSSNQAT